MARRRSLVTCPRVSRIRHYGLFANKLIAKDRPSLAILEHDPPRIDGMETCRAIRQQDNDHEHQLPVVMVASQEDQASGAAAGVTDWLIKPLTGAYARTKIRAWVLRTACQWMWEVIPENEERRLARPHVHVQQRHRAGARARGLPRPMPQKGTEKRRSSENVISTDKSALLWMYCREIAPFETPTFSNKVGELIARAHLTRGRILHVNKRNVCRHQVEPVETGVGGGGGVESCRLAQAIHLSQLSFSSVCAWSSAAVMPVIRIASGPPYTPLSAQSHCISAFPRARL